MRNSFHQLTVDEFGDLSDIPSIYPRNPFDDDGADNIFGLGNKQKKAERKLKKAEKKLAKGQTRKAEKKIHKAERLLSSVSSGVASNQPAIDQLRALSGQITSTTNPAQVESMSTPAGQIGSAAQPVLSPQSSIGGGTGGGGGDMSSGDLTPYSAETGDTSAIGNVPTESLSTPDNPVIMPDVTVTATKKNNTIMLLIIAAIVIAAIFFFSKKGNKLLK